MGTQVRKCCVTYLVGFAFVFSFELSLILLSLWLDGEMTQISFQHPLAVSLGCLTLFYVHVVRQLELRLAFIMGFFTLSLYVSYYMIFVSEQEFNLLEATFPTLLTLVTALTVSLVTNFQAYVRTVEFEISFLLVTELTAAILADFNVVSDALKAVLIIALPALILFGSMLRYLQSYGFIQKSQAPTLSEIMRLQQEEADDQAKGVKEPKGYSHFL